MRWEALAACILLGGCKGIVASILGGWHRQTAAAGAGGRSGGALGQAGVARRDTAISTRFATCHSAFAAARGRSAAYSGGQLCRPTGEGAAAPARALKRRKSVHETATNDAEGAGSCSPSRRRRQSVV